MSIKKHPVDRHIKSLSYRIISVNFEYSQFDFMEVDYFSNIKKS